MADRRKASITIALVVLLLGNVAIFAAGAFASNKTTYDRLAIGLSLFAIALWSFFASFFLSRAAFPSWDERAYFRTALALAFTMLWFSAAITIMVASTRNTLPQDSPGRVVFGALTEIVKFVLAFYFVAEAGAQVADRAVQGRADRAAETTQPRTTAG
jgi:hypothetical protein